MTVKEIARIKECRLATQGKMEETITGVFCCDLLSIAMSKAPSGCAWVTVMANKNTIAVASLTDTACVILAEGVHLNESDKKCAIDEGITVFETDLPIFETALAIHRLRAEQ